VIFAVAVMLLLASTSIAQRGFQDLVGNWEAVSKVNESGGLQVIDSTKIFLVYGDHKMPITAYQADFSKVPAWFDFTVKDSTREIRLKSLLQFVNDDTIQWQIFEEDTRPVIFASDRGEMVYLKRKKQQ